MKYRPIRSSVCPCRVAHALVLGFALAAAAGPPAIAQPFTFSTGNPDARIATASRPGPTTGANQETETGDDFAPTMDVLISQASFTGLLPSGEATDVSQVHIEIYRVFPLDSNIARTSGPPQFSTSQVPTRVNSPSDVAFADLHSDTSMLTFSTTLLAASFTANNSVDLGIHPQPSQTTGGDGPVTGDEVRIDATFTPALMLPAGHYFFVPQVLLGNPDQHFLWLSAPKPIVAPGTPFSPDLQSWIRNAGLEPDWLRVGADIVGGTTTFNAAFSLQGEIFVTPTATVTPTSTPTSTPVGQGGACSADTQCSTGFCVDGVCCEAACSAPLARCNLPGQRGTCVSAAASAPTLMPSGLIVAAVLLTGIAAFALRHRNRSR